MREFRVQGLAQEPPLNFRPSKSGPRVGATASQWKRRLKVQGLELRV